MKLPDRRSSPMAPVKQWKGLEGGATEKLWIPTARERRNRNPCGRGEETPVTEGMYSPDHPDYYPVYQVSHIMLGGAMITNLSESPRLERLAQLADSNGPMIAWMGGITGVLIGLAFIAAVVMVIAAVVSALTNEDTSGGGKLLWVIFILWFPLFGAIAWFVVGKKGHLNRFLGIDRGRARHTIPTSVGQHSNIVPDQVGLGRV